jgi:cell division inhibitor SulA
MGQEQRRGPLHQEAPLLDALGQLSQSDSGWILLVAPPGLPAAAQLQARGINPARVLVCTPQDQELAADLLGRA